MTINHISSTFGTDFLLRNAAEQLTLNYFEQQNYNNYNNNDNFNNKSSTATDDVSSSTTTTTSDTALFSSQFSINLDKVYKKLTPQSPPIPQQQQQQEVQQEQQRQQRPSVLTVSQLILKKIEKHNSSIPELRHKPYVPSRLGTNRSDDLSSRIYHLPSERYNNIISKEQKTKFNLSPKMIESTAAYRAGDQSYGWINTESEEYSLKKNEETEELSIISFGGDFLFFDSTLPIRDSNLRIDEDRPKLERSSSNKKIKL